MVECFQSGHYGAVGHSESVLWPVKSVLILWPAGGEAIVFLDVLA